MLPKVESQITIAYGRDKRICSTPKDWLGKQPDMVKIITDIIENEN